MSAALEEITRQIKEEARVALLEQVRAIRTETNPGTLQEVRKNIKTLLSVKAQV